MKETCTICGREDDPQDYISSPIKKLMIENHCCFHCAYWFNRPKENLNGNLVPVIVNREHWSFRMGEGNPYAKVSFNKSIPIGEYKYILFEDGRLVIVTQLRFQGNIPEYFERVLPNNAVFISEAEYQQILNMQTNKSSAPASAKCPQPLLNFLLEKYHFTK